MGRVEVSQVDVFAEVPFAGNPAAVVLGADGMSDAMMQAIAREMNLSETAFVFAENERGEVPVRFFTPTREVPLCGHATLAAHFVRGRALAQAAGEVVQRSPGGAWRVRWQERGGRPFLTMLQGPVDFGASWAGERLAALLDALGASGDALTPGWPVQTVSTGHAKVLVPLREPDALFALAPDMGALASLSAETGVGGYFAFTVGGDGGSTSARMFGPAIGVAEDPVNGSGHGPLGAYLRQRSGPAAARALEGFWSSMGVHLGRPGKVWVRVVDAVHVEVGGFVAPVFHASMEVGEA